MLLILAGALVINDRGTALPPVSFLKDQQEDEPTSAALLRRIRFATENLGLKSQHH